ncbi:hypothetical protein CKAH01_11223 [Colletotrichum kahawae]|uniref:DUF6536 domain-containing protein n=1 Tax=Colletotrichum kahawae TaxID=34407 RepID=A0AAD9XUR6_COLKA|nr:hypothetical protein CKAH01_11223 [Colletotrichum kahawae]
MKIPFRPTFYQGRVPLDLWRRSALSFAAAALFTFIVNFSFTVWGITREASDGIGVIWEGEQKTVKIWNTTLHVIINIISTVLLAGSNYCMQCLMAPTRMELDTAHSKRKWLDIGIPTIRNFWGITLRRKFNSIIFASITPAEYRLFFVEEESLLNGSSSWPKSLNRSQFLAVPDLFPNTTLHHLTVSECLAGYGNEFQSSRGDLLIVTNEGNKTPNNTVGTDFVSSSASSGISWMCTSYSDDKPCDEEISDIKKNPESWRPYGLEVKACYSEAPEEHSRLLFSSTICYVVTALNLLKAILMLLVAYGDTHIGERPILTVGDAVASYLEYPDDRTQGMCLRSKKDFVKRDWESHAKQFDPTPRRKCLLALSICGFLLAFGLASLRTYSGRMPPLSKFGPGVIHSDTIMDNNALSEDSDSLMFNVILANVPQVLMSLIYFNYNALFTCISLATEWDRFYSGSKKGLRVSTKPQGNQRQTYFLQLPYRYSLTLAVLSGGLHWLISQSIFLVRIEIYDHDEGTSQADITACGWSPVGIILVIVAGAVLIGLLVASGFRRLRHGGIPVAGSCSAAIAAACHADPSERDSLARLPLTWGVVSGKDVDPGHCSFTSKDVEKPAEGCLYK